MTEADGLGDKMTVLRSVAWAACTTAVLVPTPLVEPRYFLIPLILLRLHLELVPSRAAEVRTNEGSEVPDRRHHRPGHTVKLREEIGSGREVPGRLWVEYAWYTGIHAATLGLFLVRKFRWEGWEGWMRFMW
jgi:alpha-1,2-glucosyltransferase